MRIPFLIWLLVATINLPAQSAKELVRQGNELYKKGNYSEALRKYEEALQQEPDLLKGKFNQGDALYQLGEYEEAIQNFEQLANAFDQPELQSNAYHNLGNAYLKAQQYDKSIEAYKKSLKLNPQADDTRYNLAYAQAIKQQQQKDQQQKDQKQDQQKKDDQQQPQQKDDQQQQQQPKPGELTKKQAEQILQALENDERRVQEKMNRQKAKATGKKVEKDW